MSFIKFLSRNNVPPALVASWNHRVDERECVWRYVERVGKAKRTETLLICFGAVAVACLMLLIQFEPELRLQSAGMWVYLAAVSSGAAFYFTLRSFFNNRPSALQASSNLMQLQADLEEVLHQLQKGDTRLTGLEDLSELCRRATKALVRDARDVVNSERQRGHEDWLTKGRRHEFEDQYEVFAAFGLVSGGYGPHFQKAQEELERNNQKKIG